MKEPRKKWKPIALLTAFPVAILCAFGVLYLSYSIKVYKRRVRTSQIPIQKLSTDTNRVNIRLGYYRDDALGKEDAMRVMASRLSTYPDARQFRVYWTTKPEKSDPNCPAGDGQSQLFYDRDKKEISWRYGSSGGWCPGCSQVAEDSLARSADHDQVGVTGLCGTCCLAC